MDHYKEKRAKLFEDKFDEQKKVPQKWFVGLLWGVVGLAYLIALVGIIILIGVILQ